MQEQQAFLTQIGLPHYVRPVHVLARHENRLVATALVDATTALAVSSCVVKVLVTMFPLG